MDFYMALEPEVITSFIPITFSEIQVVVVSNDFDILRCFKWVILLFFIRCFHIHYFPFCNHKYLPISFF